MAQPAGPPGLQEPGTHGRQEDGQGHQRLASGATGGRQGGVRAMPQGQADPAALYDIRVDYESTSGAGTHGPLRAAGVHEPRSRTLCGYLRRRLHRAVSRAAAGVQVQRQVLRQGRADADGEPDGPTRQGRQDRQRERVPQRSTRRLLQGEGHQAREDGALHATAKWQG